MNFSNTWSKLQRKTQSHCRYQNGLNIKWVENSSTVLIQELRQYRHTWLRGQRSNFRQPTDPGQQLAVIPEVTGHFVVKCIIWVKSCSTVCIWFIHIIGHNQAAVGNFLLARCVFVVSETLEVWINTSCNFALWNYSLYVAGVKDCTNSLQVWKNLITCELITWKRKKRKHKRCAKVLQRPKLLIIWCNLLLYLNWAVHFAPFLGNFYDLVALYNKYMQQQWKLGLKEILFSWHCTWLWLRFLVPNMHYSATVATLAGYGHHTFWFVRNREGQRSAHYCCGCVTGLFVVNIQMGETRLILQQDWFCQREQRTRDSHEELAS